MRIQRGRGIIMMAANTYTSQYVGNEVIISGNRTCRLLFSETTRPNARARVRPERPQRVQGVPRRDVGTDSYQFLADTLTLF